MDKPVSDTYRTIKAFSQGIYKEKGSRFVGLAFPVSCEAEIKQILSETRKEHHDARHHCYAYVMGADGSVWRANDDGEPSGTGGKPILGQIRSLELTNLLIVVPRYFGGTLLGTSGLINAYRSAAENTLSNAIITNHIIHQKCNISFPYSSMNDVMKILKEEEIRQAGHSYELTCRITIWLRLSEAERMRSRLLKAEGLEIDLLEVS
jgi:uncharacterized YigZ family protein